MTIYEITPQTSLRSAAVIYLMAGFSVVPLKGKQASVPWTVYQKQRARNQDLQWWDMDGLLKNIGIICGAVSENLVVIDLDGEWAIKTVSENFPALLDTFTVNTGSGRGQHLYFRVDSLPPTTKHTRGDHNGVELRANGSYVAAPPSIHPNTAKPYEIASKRPIRKLAELHYFKTWLDGLNHQRRSIETPEKRPTIVFVEQGVLLDKDGNRVKNPRRYALFALDTEAGRLAAQADHRNDHINLSAFRMGQFVKRGLLTETEVETALFNCARRWSDMSDREILATIRSGLQDGQQKGDGR